MKILVVHIFVFFLVIHNLLVVAQNENNKWYFGNGAGLDFMTVPPATLTGNMSTLEGCASVADAAGNLLFYTDGSTVWNSAGFVMGNGTGMGGNNSTTQSAIIVKQPGNANIYYIFSQDIITGGNFGNFYYSIVDMNMAAGFGSVTVNASLISTGHTEKLTSVRHCNGTDFWVLSCPVTSGIVNAYLVSAAGVNTVPVVSTVPGLNQGTYGAMKISSNGSKIVFANSSGPLCYVCDFSNASGIVSNPIILSGTNAVYGVEFSPNGAVLYATSFSSPNFFQWDLCAGSANAIAASVYTLSSPFSLTSMQLATDGKIYISKAYQPNLAVINNPDNLGAACNFTLNSDFTFGTGVFCYFGLPNFITGGYSSPGFTYTLGPVYGCNTASFTSFGSQGQSQSPCSGIGNTIFQWNFGDPFSGAANTSTLANPTHPFSSAGTYTATLLMTTPCGTTFTLTQQVNVNLVCISVVSQSITCANPGSATVTVLNIPGPFTYTWLPGGQSSSVAIGLNPGTHTICATDINSNFTSSFTVTFVSPVPFTGTLSNSLYQPCAAYTSGTASIALSGGSANQTYSWTGSSGTQTSTTATGLGTGNYSVTVVDGLTSCSINQTFTIGPPPPLLGVMVIASAPSVCAGSPASFTAYGYGGTPNISGWTYSWSGGSSGEICNVSPVMAGAITYTVNVFDANNCLANTTVSLNVVAVPIVSLAGAQICPLQTATLTATGATTYSWNTGISTATLADTPTLTTVYTVTGSAQGCAASATASIVLNAAPIVTLATNSPVCTGQTLSLYGSAGAAYSWAGPGGFTSLLQNPQINSAALINGGVYNYTVTAANSCTAASAINATVNQTPNLAATGATVCTTQTINLLANATGFPAYSWTGPGGFTSTLQNPAIPNPPLSATGIYTVSVLSANSCSNSTTVNVGVAAVPLPVFTSDSPKCQGTTLNFSSTGSSGALSCVWNGPNGFTTSGTIAFINSVSMAANGTYTLTLMNGPCIASISHPVVIFPTPVPLILTNSPLCESKTLSLSVNNPYPVCQWAGPLNYTGSTLDVNFIAATLGHSGIYTVVVTDNNTCQGSSTIAIAVMPNPTLTVFGADVCYEDPAIIKAAGASGYSWSGPDNFMASTPQATINSALNTTPQTYYVTGTALNTCSTVASVQVTTRALPIATASLNPRACIGSTVYFEGDGGNKYHWTGPLNFNGHQQSFSKVVVNLGMAGIYTLTVIDTSGCKGETTANLIVDPKPTGILWSSNPQRCVPFCSDIKLAATGTPIVSGSWRINDDLFTNELVRYCFTEATDYTLTGNFTDANNCRADLSFVISTYPLPISDFTYAPEVSLENEDVQFTSTSAGSELENWSWFFETNDQHQEGYPVANHIFKEAGTYPVAMVVKNKWGCEDTITKAIVIEEDFSIYLPNAFTPNADGLNETFYAVGSGVKTFLLLIYDRWGEKVFETTDISKGWDATFKGEACKSDVYTWKMVTTSLRGKEKSLTGSVLVYR